MNAQAQDMIDQAIDQLNKAARVVNGAGSSDTVAESDRRRRVVELHTSLADDYLHAASTIEQVEMASKAPWSPYVQSTPLRSTESGVSE